MTFAPVKTISPPDRAQWSATDPDVIYGEAGTRVVSYNVVTGGGVLVVRKVSTCIDAPDSRMADRMVPPGTPG